MTFFRIAAIVAFAAALIFAGMRKLERRASRTEPLLGQITGSFHQPEEARLLAHQTDSILATDLQTGLPLALGFPRSRPVVAFLYQRECQACRRAKPTWEAVARVAAPRADLLAATLDPAGDGTPYVTAPGVRHLRFYTRAPFQRAFGIWNVVPITLLIAPSGQVRWARIGVPDSASVQALINALMDD